MCKLEEFLCCTPETNVRLYVNYPQGKKKKGEVLALGGCLRLQDVPLGLSFFIYKKCFDNNAHLEGW